MVVARAQDFVDQIAVIGEKNKPLGILVEATNGKNAHAVINKIDDIVSHRTLGSAFHAHWFIEGDKNQSFFIARFDLLAVDFHQVIGKNQVACSM